MLFSNQHQRPIKMSKVHIRPARHEESQRVFDLLAEYADFDGSRSSLRATHETLTQELFGENPTLKALVAEREGQLVGILLYYFSFSSWQAKKCFWIEDLYLIDEVRGMGVGRLFLEESKSIARDQDCARVDWHVRRSNTHARAFYEHMGASIDDETIPVYWAI